MELSLTWDLLVIVFFAIVVAYSFIVGKDESVKIIIASYISIVSVQAIGNLLDMLSMQSSTMMDLMGFQLNGDVVSIIKLILFVAMIIFLSIRGGFEMQYAKELSGVWDPVVTGAFGFATAGLLLSALLTYISAKPLLDATLTYAPLLQPLLRDSELVPIMVDYQNMWFCLPGLLLLAVGFISTRKE